MLEKKISFSDRVLNVVKAIPVGKTMSYQQVAAAAGNARASRAVGTIMAKNYREDIPCHRVIKANGKPGSYNRGGEKRKREILEQEGARL
jgi:methylated-DNA-[protein]-cysteine S-methyltransferase